MIVHDMRGPLQVLLASLQLLEDGPAVLDALAAQDIRSAIQSAESLSAMANDVLDVSRLEEARMPIARVSLDLVEIARDVVARLSGLDLQRRIALRAPD